jgi:hypothetical protein
MITINYVRKYKAASGKIIFVYVAECSTPEELEQFKQDAGFKSDAEPGYFAIDKEHHKPIWRTTEYVGESTTLEVSSKGKLYAETEKLQKAASICRQFGIETAKSMFPGVLEPVGKTTVVEGTEAPASEPSDLFDEDAK